MVPLRNGFQRLSIGIPASRPAFRTAIRWKSKSKRTKEETSARAPSKPSLGRQPDPEPGYSERQLRLREEMDKAAYHGDVPETMRIFELLGTKAIGEAPISPRFRYNMVMKAFAQNGDTGRAEAWYLKMRQAKVSPNEKTFGKLVAAAAAKGDVATAEKWLKALEEHSKVTVVALNAAATAYAKAGRPDMVEKCLARFRKHGFKIPIQAFGSMIDALAQLGRADEAVAWLGKLEASKLEPNEIIYCCIVNAFANAGKPVEARKWFETMESKGIRPSVATYSALLNAYARVGMVHEARLLLEEMEYQQLYVDVVTYTSLMAASWRNSVASTAEKVEHVKEWLTVMEDSMVEKDVVAYGFAITNAAQRSASKEAVGLFNEMITNKVMPDETCQTGVLFAFANEGLPIEANEWIERCQRSDLFQGAQSYHHVVNAFGCANDIPETWKLFRTMDGQGIKPHGYTYAAVMDSVIASKKTSEGAEESAGKLLKLMAKSSVNINMAHLDLCVVRLRASMQRLQMPSGSAAILQPTRSR